MFLIFRSDLTQDEFPLTAEETRHVRARRLEPGDELFIGDGRGNRRAACLLADLRSVRAMGAPRAGVEPERILCTAIPSAGRWDWLLQKATEVGATGILPFTSRRSERSHPGKRGPRIIEAAAAQSQRFLLPALMNVVSLSELPAALAELGADLCFVLDPRAGVELAQQDLGNAQRPAVVVGPEGGLTAEERQVLAAADFVERRLGATVLRVETAAVVALGRLSAVDTAGHRPAN